MSVTQIRDDDSEVIFSILAVVYAYSFHDPSTYQRSTMPASRKGMCFEVIQKVQYGSLASFWDHFQCLDILFLYLLFMLSAFECVSFILQ